MPAPLDAKKAPTVAFRSRFRWAAGSSKCRCYLDPRDVVLSAVFRRMPGLPVVADARVVRIWRPPSSGAPFSPFDKWGLVPARRLRKAVSGACSRSRHVADWQHSPAFVTPLLFRNEPAD
jgi:hypothetical protein